MSNIPTEGLVFYDSFAGDTADTGQTRTVMGDMQIVTDPFSGLKNSVAPGGSSFMYSTTGMADNTGNRTMSIWVKGGSLLSEGEYQAFFCAGQPLAGKHSTINFQTGGKVVFSSADTNTLQTPENALNQLAWNHILLTQETGASSVTVSVYINNVLAVSGERALEIVAGDNLIIGGGYWNSAVQDAFTGTIMAPRMYNRVLSEAERSTLYQEFDQVESGGGDNILLSPATTVPTTGSPGLLYGNLFIPLEKSAPSVIPVEGLTAYYPLTENANDLSGNGRHGAPSSGVTFSCAAAKLTAYPQYIDIPTDAIPANLFTVSMWATSVFNYQRYPMIFFLGTEGGNTAIGLGYHADGYSSILFSTWGDDWYEGNNEADPMVPHHYLITYDGSASALALYVDGIYRDTLNVSVDIGTLRRIGQGNDAAMQSMYQWVGAFWSFRAYNRVLTRNEISALAAEFAPASQS